MRALTGWLALGIGLKADLFVEATGYDRQPFGARGSPEMDSLPGFAGPTDPVDRHITHFAIFDQPVAGHCVAYWKAVPPLTTIPARVPGLDFMMMLNLPVTHGVNATVLSGATSELVDVARGEKFGTINGQSMISGCRLAVHAGQLVARARLTPRRLRQPTE